MHIYTYACTIYAYSYIYIGTSLVAQMIKNLPAMWETQVWSLGWEDPLEKGMATHSSIRLENSMDRGAWQAAGPWGLKDSDTTEWLMLSLSFQSVSMQTSKNNKVGTSLAVQWLRIHASTLGLTPVVVQSPSCIRLCIRPHGLQYFRPPCPSPSPRVCPFWSLIRELRCCMPHGMAKRQKKNK